MASFSFGQHESPSSGAATYQSLLRAARAQVVALLGACGETANGRPDADEIFEIARKPRIGRAK